MPTTAVLTLTARPELTTARYALLRFEGGPIGQRRSWYGVAVTGTLASQIRQLAAERNYDRLDNAGKIAVRNEIAELLGATRQAVYKALKQTGGWGGAGRRQRTLTHRCPACDQALLTQAAEEHLEQFLAKRKKRQR